MTVPDFLPVPPLPSPREVVPDRPWVVDQRPGSRGYVRVTFATPSLRRIVVSVPESAWLDGEHLAAGLAAYAAMQAIEPVAVDDAVEPLPD